MNPQPALGMIETTGIVGLIAGADAAAKAANVKVVSREGADAGIVTVYIVGDVASVMAAVQAGRDEAWRAGHFRSAHVIPRPDPDVLRQIGFAPESADRPEKPRAPGKSRTRKGRR